MNAPSPRRRFTDAFSWDRTHDLLIGAGIGPAEAEGILYGLRDDEEAGLRALAAVPSPPSLAHLDEVRCRHCDDQRGGCSECDDEAHYERLSDFRRGQ